MNLFQAPGSSDLTSNNRARALECNSVRRYPFSITAITMAVERAYHARVPKLKEKLISVLEPRTKHPEKSALSSVFTLLVGRADVGIKRLFLPCCIKGKFYANLTLLHKGKILCQPRLAVTARQAFMPSSLA